MARITSAGLALMAQLQSSGSSLVIDKFVYANIDGLDPELAPPASEALPDVANIVYESAVSKAGYVGPDTVVYSNVMSSAVGDFYFNWIGLYCSEHGVLVAVSYVPLQNKKATSGFQMGNMLTKTFALQYTDVTDLTGVEINAETWQIDVTARLQQIDERERLSNYDIYGTKYFFGDAFLLVDNAGNYEIQPGVAYIDGIRVILAEDQALGDTGDLPKYIYLDACLNGDITGVEALWSVQISDAEQAHYTDAANQQHYLEKIATINPDGTITDNRGEGTGGTIRDLANAEDLVNEHNQDPAAHPKAFASHMLTAATTINFTPDMTAADINALIAAVPKNLNGYNLTFQFADGTYTLDETITFSSFYSGVLSISGNQTDDTTAGGEKSVNLSFSSGIGLQIVYCSCNVVLSHLNIPLNNSSDMTRCVCISSNPGSIECYYCNFDGGYSENYKYNYGIYVTLSTLYCSICLINNCHTAYYFDLNAYVNEYYTVGSGNVYFCEVNRSTMTSQNAYWSGRYCDGALYTRAVGTINGHSADRIGDIVSSGKLTREGAHILQGGPISKTDYPLLVAKAEASGWIKTAAEYNADNTLRTYFHEHDTDDTLIYLPDWRGVVTRGIDKSGTFDPEGASRSLMSYQGDDVIQKALEGYGTWSSGSVVNTLLYAATSGSANGIYNVNDGSSDSWLTMPNTRVGSGAETRGKNVAVNYFIYFN